MSECDSCTTKSVAACAACLEGPVLDMDGQPLEFDVRVRVPPRPGLAGGAEVPGYTGFVKSATAERVRIEEIGSFNERDAHPSQCRIKTSVTKGTTDHLTARAALRGTTQTKRGLKQFASDTQEAPPTDKKKGRKARRKK